MLFLITQYSTADKGLLWAMRILIFEISKTSENDVVANITFLYTTEKH